MEGRARHPRKWQAHGRGPERNPYYFQTPDALSLSEKSAAPQERNNHPDGAPRGDTHRILVEEPRILIRHASAFLPLHAPRAVGARAVCRGVRETFARLRAGRPNAIHINRRSACYVALY